MAFVCHPAVAGPTVIKSVTDHTVSIIGITGVLLARGVGVPVIAIILPVYRLFLSLPVAANNCAVVVGLRRTEVILKAWVLFEISEALEIFLTNFINFT